MFVVLDLFLWIIRRDCQISSSGTSSFNSVYHCWAIILIAYACIVAFARIPYFERGLSIGGNIRFDIPVAHLYAAVFLFLGRSLYGVCISAFSVRMHNCGKAIDFLLVGCGGEMPVVGVRHRIHRPCLWLVCVRIPWSCLHSSGW